MNLSCLFFAVALLGALITMQTGSNTRLKEAFGEALPAVIVSSSLGVILLIAVTLGARTPWPPLSSLAGAPWWGWLEGRHGVEHLGPRLNCGDLVALAGQEVLQEFKQRTVVVGDQDAASGHAQKNRSACWMAPHPACWTARHGVGAVAHPPAIECIRSVTKNVASSPRRPAE